MSVEPKSVRFVILRGSEEAGELWQIWQLEGSDMDYEPPVYSYFASTLNYPIAKEIVEAMSGPAGSRPAPPEP